MLGASSMGALRAAECARFGMEGVGEVFRQYRDGERSADADVAVTHATAELDWQPLTLALVDVEHGLGGLADRAAAGSIMRLSRRLHYKNRTWDRLLEGAPASAIEALRQATSLKQQDALLLLLALAAARPAQPWPLARSLFLDQLIAKTRREAQ